jgi:release factor glutamine methyltransferase
LRTIADIFRLFSTAAPLQRRTWEPVAYITGRQEFWSLDFRYADVLIPRSKPSGYRVITYRRLDANKSLRVLDIGTGSGASP